MPAWNSSSLSFSDHNLGRHGGSGLLKNLSSRISKQHLSEHKMFGSKRKGIQIGKMFRKKGKGVMKGATSASMTPKLKGGGISPSIGEFDKMMSSITKGSGSKNGSRPSRKFFG